jgi:hypothetical protein
MVWFLEHSSVWPGGLGAQQLPCEGAESATLALQAQLMEVARTKPHHVMTYRKRGWPSTIGAGSDDNQQGSFDGGNDKENRSTEPEGLHPVKLVSLAWY